MKRCPDSFSSICFVVKNNLAYKVASVTILFLAYNKYGSVVDYTEEIFFRCWSDNDKCGIKPFLAKTVDLYEGGERAPKLSLEYGSIIKARILDFEIIDD